MPAPIPLIAGYSELTLIGHGGFGSVYKARHAELDRFVAIKVLERRLTDDRARASFDRECRAMAWLSRHPYIVTIMGTAFTQDLRPCLVMELYSGGDYGTRIRRHGPIPIGEILPLGVGISGALSTAHQYGIIHGDVKPENVFLSEYESPALGDFGIAVLGRNIDEDTAPTFTPVFAAPEMVGGQVAVPTAATDQFALGTTLYTLATGVFPAVGKELHVPVRLPPILMEVIERTRAEQPEDRYPDLLEVGAALNRVEHRLGYQPTAIPTPSDGSGDPTTQQMSSREDEPAAAIHTSAGAYIARDVWMPGQVAEPYDTDGETALTPTGDHLDAGTEYRGERTVIRQPTRVGSAQKTENATGGEAPSGRAESIPSKPNGARNGKKRLIRSIIGLCGLAALFGGLWLGTRLFSQSSSEIDTPPSTPVATVESTSTQLTTTSISESFAATSTAAAPPSTDAREVVHPAPPSPAKVEAVRDEDGIVVEWVSNDEDQLSMAIVTGYRVYVRGLTDDAWELAGETSGETRTYKVGRELHADETYVVAVEALSDSGKSQRTQAEPVGPIVFKPTSVRIKRADSTLRVEWTPAVQPGSEEITGFEVYLQIDDGPWAEPVAVATAVSSLLVQENVGNTNSYKAAVVAVGSSGSSERAYSSLSTAFVPPPTNVVLTRKDSALEIRWLSPSDNDAAQAITGYMVYIQPEGGEWIPHDQQVTVQTFTPETPTTIEIGADNDVRYKVAVESVTRDSRSERVYTGLSDTFSSSTVTTRIGRTVTTVTPRTTTPSETEETTRPIGKPTSVRLSRGDRSLTVEWKADSTSSQSVDEYHVYVREDPGQWTLLSTVAAGSLRTHIDGVANDKSLKAYVVARAKSDFSDPAYSPTVGPFIPKASNVRIDRGFGTLKIRWDSPPYSDVDRITGYVVGIQMDGGVWEQVAEVSATRRVADVTGIVNKLPYKAYVQVVTSYGDGPRAYTAWATRLITVPNAFLSEIASSDQLVLAWRTPAEDTMDQVTSFSLYLRVDDSGWQLMATVGPRVTEYRLTPPYEGLTYRARVDVETRTGTAGSTYSNEVGG